MQRAPRVCLAAAALSLALPAAAQYNERPALIGSGEAAVDCSGRSIKNPRTRAVHTADPNERGGSAYLLQRDPFLAYQLGRNLNFREFRTRDGVFDGSVAGLGGPMPDGTTAKITARNQTSCLGCHNLPSGNPGGGTSFHKDSGLGRNAPHYYGAGLVEMLALQTRHELLLLVDSNADGWISASEARAAPDPIRIEPSPGAVPIDYGSARLSAGATGTPQLNNIFRIWYVDASGRVVPGATEVDGVTTFGYGFNMVVWGWGQGPGRNALNPTNRVFYWDPANAHGGLQAHDPSSTNDPDGDGVSEPTLAGAEQFPATHLPPDGGADLDALGFSRDDPDGDGHLNEISEGDLDLAEWFMLNTPRPAFAGTPAEYDAGVDLMQRMGCTECHVADWQIESQDGGYAGDRRFIDFDVNWNDSAGRLEGRLVRLFDEQGGVYTPKRGSFRVAGLFSDLKHHDMGAGFSEIDFGGFKNTVWRTAPLWGVGSGFPWGHDGQSLTLEHAILRHDGAGARSKTLYLAAPRPQRDALLTFLERLVLYDVESLPADIDGDGVVATDFIVAGMNTGLERFNAEWLFVNPVRIQGFVAVDGRQITSFAAVNRKSAYGELLKLRADSDLDGWPDVWDHAPNVRGYKDGVR